MRKDIEQCKLRSSEIVILKYWILNRNIERQFRSRLKFYFSPILKSFQAVCHRSSFDYEQPYQISIKLHRYKVPFKTVQTTQISYFTSLLIQQLSRSFLLTILYTNSEHCFLRISVWSSAYLKFKPTIYVVQTIVENQILLKSSDKHSRNYQTIHFEIHASESLSYVDVWPKMGPKDQRSHHQPMRPGDTAPYNVVRSRPACNFICRDPIDGIYTVGRWKYVVKTDKMVRLYNASTVPLP